MPQRPATEERLPSLYSPFMLLAFQRGKPTPDAPRLISSPAARAKPWNAARHALICCCSNSRPKQCASTKS